MPLLRITVPLGVPEDADTATETLRACDVVILPDGVAETVTVVEMLTGF